MASRKHRYAVDPSLVSRPEPTQQTSYGQRFTQQQPYGQQQQGFTQPQQYPQQPTEPSTYGVQPPRQRIWADDLAPPPPPFVPASTPPPTDGYPASHSAPPPVNHIPQPPHAAGPSLRGPKPRIDPSQVPSAVDVAEMDQNLYDQEDFESCNTKGLVPLGTTDYRGIDQGNSLPRYIRASLTHVPATNSLLETSQLPFGVIISPFANPRYDEEPIPYVTDFLNQNASSDAGASTVGGPPRCGKCRGYINPWCKWIDGGQKWQCNLCNSTNPVSQSYFSHLDSYGNRMDLQSRPELRCGTVDFPVPKAYWANQPSSLLDSSGLSTVSGDLLASLNEAVDAAASAAAGSEVHVHAPIATGAKGRKEKKPHAAEEDDQSLRAPMPIGRVFVVDVSWSAVRSGMLYTVCQGIKEALYGPAEADVGVEGEGGEDVAQHEVPPGRVAIITFDRAVHFYNLSHEKEKAQMMVCSDVDDIFLPLARGFLVDPKQSKSQIMDLLETLPRLYQETQYGEVAMGAAVKGALAGLYGCGGQVCVFLSSLPNWGPGALKSREDPLLYGTDKEKSLYSPAIPFWRNTAEELAESGVGVNTFLFPERYIDAASVGILSTVTGGSVFFHPRFDANRDRFRVNDEIKRVLVRDIAYNVAVRLRCSNGLRVHNHIGNFHQRSLTDLEAGTMDPEQSLGAVLRHDGKLDERSMAFIQAAVLYTSATGERRVRTMNLSFPVTNHIGNLFKFSDFDTGMALLYKDAVTQALTKSLSDVRRGLTERCVRVMAMYRKHVAVPTSMGQLVLPESYKLMPMYTLAMIKSKALKGGQVAADVRSLYIRSIRSMSFPQIMMNLYPRMFGVHDLPENVGYLGPNSRLELPQFMRISHSYMVADGAYMLINGEVAMLWIGHAVSPQVINDLYAVENPDELDIRITQLPKLPSYLSTQVRNLLAHHERILGHQLPVIIARQNLDGTEIEFANMLLEDANNDAYSYVEYLMSVHKSVTEEISGGGSGQGWKAPWSSS
ncbi:hypothetical protein QFC22_002107 [Naganishia vaughanmartiniae]|uniref:Uncharacterized protein n=1 Tax=Naganishia vaughanmartiniae TaxID=1424756 RepID=A0ACC2XCZ0_9TREE|nr:hypothetical protein QFC22_002107 [Naganishia vaughanmartiniae]